VVVGMAGGDAVVVAERPDQHRREVAQRRDAELRHLVEVGQVHDLGDLAAADDANADGTIVHVNPSLLRPSGRR
jgi:hypothetical protein